MLWCVLFAIILRHASRVTSPVIGSDDKGEPNTTSSSIEVLLFTRDDVRLLSGYPVVETTSVDVAVYLQRPASLSGLPAGGSDILPPKAIQAISTAAQDPIRERLPPEVRLVAVTSYSTAKKTSENSPAAIIAVAVVLVVALLSAVTIVRIRNRSGEVYLFCALSVCLFVLLETFFQQVLR